MLKIINFYNDLQLRSEKCYTIFWKKIILYANRNPLVLRTLVE